MTKEELANRLDGAIYTEEMIPSMERQAKEAGLVVVFGASDDLILFRGAIRDEGDCYDGGDILVYRGGLMERHEDCECKYCGYPEAKKSAVVITALWDDGTGYSWTYRTSIPHATFDVMVDNEKYCRGIVFEIKDFQKI